MLGLMVWSLVVVWVAMVLWVAVGYMRERRGP